ncbi:mechanosensitive ion channel family protein [Marinirhabdus gelatinilytica]|uniref:Small conductance mechanosensitive channel n=1 Tax=Marinirhabdus gelatinilytica TaxID=1703343 RepID=A0A370QIF1_9FLAO|nr:mechanosensitive ion channel domain-containing protein [Marinirhabdus gelatinilytica]RDK88136.1 small conductance mechanosensitive channel [Marinirhabdus gelatinilytica]
MFSTQKAEEILETYGKKLIDFLPDLLLAIIILVVGLWVVKIINRLVAKFFAKKDYDITLEKFIASLLSWGLKIVLFVLVITQLGVESASLVAIIGAAGLAIGLALQGSLANFAGGVLILLLKPFKVGDFIAAQGVEGTVKEISIFNTKLNTFGNQLAVIPNGKLSNDNIINYTEEGLRRENLTFGIGYDDDIKLAKEVLLTLVNEQPEVIQLEGKAPMVVVAALADSSVNLSLRYWASIDDFWNLRWLVLEEGKARLEAAGITIPFPQRDVHMYPKN